MASETLTLAERDQARAARRAAAVAELSARLSAYGRGHGGRFLLYGSVARAQDGPRSDVDLLVDFPDARALDAACYAERMCAELGLVGDVRRMSVASDRLVARARAEGRLLG